MDFSRQCRRFLNFKVLNHENFNTKLTNISALTVLKCGQKISNQLITNYKIVIIDNDENSIYLINESDGQLISQVKIKNLQSYGLCVTNKQTKNFIYVSDFSNNLIRKFDENLKELKQFKINNREIEELNGPCGIKINYELEQIQVIDQKNCRVVCFDLKTEEYLNDLKLFKEDLLTVTKYSKPIQIDLSVKSNYKEYLELIKKRVELDFKPFGLYSKNERIFVTDWQRGFLYIYKNGILERKIGGNKLFIRPRDILLDSLDSILITDFERNSFYFMDNKGVFLFETKILKSKDSDEKGIFGIEKIENNKIVFATNTSIYICNLPS